MTGGGGELVEEGRGHNPPTMYTQTVKGDKMVKVGKMSRMKNDRRVEKGGVERRVKEWKVSP